MKWNDTIHPEALGATLTGLFDAQVKRTPDALALDAEDVRLTYRELSLRANQLAHHLIESGAGPETRVAVMLPRSVEMVVAILAAVKTGAAYVPVDPEYPAERIRYILADSGSRIVITDQSLAEHAGSTTMVVIDAPDTAETVAERMVDSPTAAVSPGSAAYLIYTSGSTGRPKGVVVEHSAISGHLQWMQDTFRLDADDRVLHKTSASFDVSVWELFWPLTVGAALVLARPDGHRDPGYLASVIVDKGVSTVHFVPSMLRAFLEHPSARGCTGLRRVLCSGEALPAPLASGCEATLGVLPYNLYGPTEAAIDVTWWPCERGADEIAIGRPVWNTQAYVLDERMEPVTTGETGELYLAGDQLARGYHGQPGLTAERFVSNPFANGTRMYRTGDLAQRRSDGTLRFVGRADQQVKLHGFRVELGEIEARLNAHPAVGEAAVVLREDQAGDQKLTAYVVPSHTRAEPICRLMDIDDAPRDTVELAGGFSAFVVNRSEAEFMAEEIFVDRMYLRGGIRLRDGASVFDIGANIGLFSLFVAANCRDPQIFAVEPMPPLRELLRDNLWVHGVRAEVLPYAMGERPASTTFTYYPHATMLSGRYADPAAEGQLVRSLLDRGLTGDPGGSVVDELVAERLETRTYECEVRTLSSVIAEHRVEHIDLLKVDVEKAEGDVLAGLTDDDWTKIDQVVVEVHDRDGRLAALTTLLEAHGYGTTALRDPRLEGTDLYQLYATRLPASPTTPADRPKIWHSARQLTEDMRIALTKSLPRYMIPSSFVLLSSFPVTSNGKLDRAALPAPEANTTVEYVAPRTDTERMLCDLCAQVLAVPRVGVLDDFFVLGGTSLAVARLVARVRAAFGVELPSSAVFENKTVVRLAHAVKTGNSLPVLPPLRSVDRSGPLPLSLPQQRVWFLEQLAPGNLAYNAQVTLRLRGDLDVVALRASLTEIVRRHEVLRTAFTTIDGEAAQQVLPFVEVDLPVIDCRRMSGEDLERLVAESVRTRFDLTRPPLARWTLLRQGSDDHTLIQVEHHFVHDGWSLARLLTELTEIYPAFAAGRSSRLPEPTLQYGDFAVWQREWMRGDVLERHLDHWVGKLRGAPQALDLPTDRLRPARQSFRGDALRLPVPAELVKRLHRFTSDHHVTLFNAMLAGFAALLSRYTGQLDLVIGTGVANRQLTETEQLLGMIVNTLPLRLDLTERPGFAELARRVRDTMIEADAWQDVPLDRLVDRLGVDRDPSRNPLFSTMFSFHDSPMPNLSFGGLRGELTYRHNGSAKTDLNVVAIPTGPEDVSLIWEYATDLFDTGTATRMVEHYFTLLTAGLSDPDCPVAALSMLSAAEAGQVLVEANRTEAPYPADATIPELFAAQVARRPNAVAICHHDTEVTYRQLDARADAVAAELRQVGVDCEVPVAILLEPGIDFAVGVLGVLKAGGAYVPINPRDPDDRIRWILADSGARAVVSRRGLADRVPNLPVAFPAEASEAFAQMVGGAQPRSLAYIIYTSGSTGRPKGVMVDHRSVARLLFGQDYIDFGPHQRITQALDPSFDGSTFELWGPLLHGGALCVVDREIVQSPRELASELRRLRVTTTLLTTALFNEVVSHVPDALAIMHAVMFGGEGADPERLRAVLTSGFAPERLVNCFGPTEATTITNSAHISVVPEGASTVPIGSPIANTTAYVLDPEMQPTGLGIPGELYVGGPGVARGYVGRPALTAERFLPDPFAADGSRMYRTGDLVRRRPDGELEFLGRTDEQVKIRGFRVEPDETRAVMAEHPDVRVAVVVVTGEGADKRLVGYAVPTPGAALDPGQLRDFVAERLPVYLVPSTIVPVDALPLTPRGKVDRAALPAPGPEMAGVPISPRTDTERHLARICEALLNVETVGVLDDFYALGGHSLLAARLVAQVNETFGTTIRLGEFLLRPRLADLASAVETDRAHTRTCDGET